MIERPIASRLIGVLVICLTLGACGAAGTRQLAAKPTAPDYQQRHAIELREAPYTLDVFAGATLDERARAQVTEFADLYRRQGNGQMVAMLPTGTRRDADYRRQFATIRQILLARGLRGTIKAGTYPISDSARAAPLHLSFTGVRARVVSTCGEWPADLASGSTMQGLENRNYWNFGCAYQSMIAAQTADPRDLVGRQAEGPKDTEMRSRAIVNVRKGQDPGSAWQTKTSSISAVGN